MSDMSLQSLPRRLPPDSRLRAGIGVLLLLGLAALLGGVIGHQPLLALLAVALAGVVVATPFVETLAVLAFWLLPYLILNLPTGAVTLKVPEVMVYLFATAALARALLRREPISLPPATPQVLLYLAVVVLSASLVSLVPTSQVIQAFSGMQGPEMRPVFVVFWLALSWLVVISLYHVVGTNPSLYRRCLCAHILSGAISSLIGIVGYVMTLAGHDAALQHFGNGHSFVYTGGSFYRLTGVSYEPLLFAYYLVTVIPASLAVAWFRPDWMPRWLAMTATLLQSLALLLTFSVGGWVALALGVVIMAWLFRPKQLNWRKAIPGLVVVLLLGGVLTYLCYSNPILNRTTGAAIGKLTKGGYKMRDEENLTGMRIFYSHFWLGAGPGMTPFYFLKYHPAAYTIDDAVSIFVNNLYINTLAETGIIGLTALAWCGFAGTAALGRVVMRCGPRRVPVLTALVVSLIGCAIQYWETQNLFLIYFPALIGLATAGARLGRSGEAAETALVRKAQ